MVYCVNSGARNPGAGVHAAAVHSYVQAAWSHAQAGAVQPEIEADAGGETEGAAGDLLRPSAVEFRIWRVGTAVNNVRNDRAELLEPVAV